MSIEVVGIMILAIALAVVLFAYDRLLRELSGLKKSRSDFELAARRDVLKTLSRARDRAVEIVGGAQIDAEKVRQIMDAEMDKLAKEQLQDYKEVLQTISKDLEEGVKMETKEYKLALEKEMEEYKLAKFRQIEDKAIAVLEEVGRKLVGKTLDFRGHTDLIISALEEAKKQNVI
jgi:hypothetical protein